MVEAAESQTVPELSCFNAKLLCVAILIPCVAFTCLVSYGITPTLTTIPILILSTVFLATFKRGKRVCLLQDAVQEYQRSDPRTPTGEKQEVEIPTPAIAAQQKSELRVESAELASASQSVSESVASDGSQLDRVGGYNDVCRNGSSSSTSVSDYDDEDSDEGLIEIALPGCDPDGSMQEQKKRSHPSYVLADSVFRHEELLELLEVISGGNEAETLIEIDISMGSIKRPRIEIEA